MTKGATILVLVVAALLLTSLGGAGIFCAPLTLPAIYLGVRRNPTWPFRVAGSLIASLTAAEVAWVGVFVLAGEAHPWIGVVPVAAIPVTFAIFLFVPARRVRAGPG